MSAWITINLGKMILKRAAFMCVIHLLAAPKRGASFFFSAHSAHGIHTHWPCAPPLMLIRTGGAHFRARRAGDFVLHLFCLGNWPLLVLGFECLALNAVRKTFAKFRVWNCGSKLQFRW
jgi:hypothetical protein